MLIDLLPSTFQGLPLHALIVHGTVIGLPLTAVALLLSAFSDRIRTRFGIVLPLAGTVCLVLVALTMASGDQIKARVYTTHSSGRRSSATSTRPASWSRGPSP